MKNIITFFLISSLVLSLSCGETRTGGNNETHDKQAANKDTVKKGKVKSADTDKNSVKEEEAQLIANSNLEDTDWQLDYSKLTLKTKMKGIYLKLFTISYKNFLDVDHVIPEHKKIENYTIRIYEEKNYFHVYFSPKRHPDPKVADSLVGGETHYGKAAHYIIERQTFKLKARYFFK